jgi:hypothetical protein
MDDREIHLTPEEHNAGCPGREGMGVERIVGIYHLLLCVTCGRLVFYDERTGDEVRPWPRIPLA